MRQRLIVFCALAQALPAAPMFAAAEEAPPIDWRGFYIGYHTGGALGLIDAQDPFGRSIFGDTVRTPGLLGGAQAGYTWQSGAIVYGLEADAGWADMNGTNTCFAYSGLYVSANCQTEIDALGTVTGRLGWLLPFDGRTLLYGKGGLAWEYGSLEATPNGGFLLPDTKSSDFEWGWTLGAGAERLLAGGWSLKAEYDFLGFDNDIFAPASLFQTAPPLANPVSIASAGADISHDIHQFKIGMNYRLGEHAYLPHAEFVAGLLPHGLPAGTEIEVGARYVYGWSQFHKDLGIMGLGLTSLASRLTYDSESTNGGELFARLDTSHNVMVKGLLGAGSGGGHMNDEDWGLEFPAAFVPYSNTLSDVDNTIRYGIVDAGYDWWRGANYRVAPFIGYAYFQQHMKGYGCTQIANPFSDCGVPLPASVLGITEYDTWQALRLGTAVDLPIAPPLRLSAEGAYLPYVTFNGTDNHVLRSLISPEDGNGVGVQLEAMLTYAVTDALSIGVGGRYWSLWTTDGNVNFGGAGVIIPMRYAVEQAQLLVQGSYRFDVAP